MSLENSANSDREELLNVCMSDEEMKKLFPDVDKRVCECREKNNFPSDLMALSSYIIFDDLYSWDDEVEEFVAEVEIMDVYGEDGVLNAEASKDKKKVKLNKPFRTPDGPKKYGVYVKNDKGNVVLVRFGDPNMEIKRDDPERRKSFRARHNCSDPGPRWKARYWSCKFWSNKKVSDLT